MVVTDREKIGFVAAVLFWGQVVGSALGQDRTSGLAPPEVGLAYRVEVAPDWTRLFYRKSGWFGADGVFSIPLNGRDRPGLNDVPGEEQPSSDSTLLIFSDTFVGEVGDDNAPLPGYKMVNNTVAYLTGRQPDRGKLRFEVKTNSSGRPQSFFVPNNRVAKPGEYYWLGDGFVNRARDDTTYLFAYHVSKTGPNVFDFAESNVSMIALPKGCRPPFDEQRQIVTPLHVRSTTLGRGSFGCAVWVNTSWAGAAQPDQQVYVYGCIGPRKSLVVARVAARQFEDFAAWRFWNGSAWSRRIEELEAITDSVSNEMSVTQLADDRFLLVFQVMGLSDKIGIRVGRSPVGPFSSIQEIYRTPESQDGLLTYNAKAHPALSKPGELLISYNTITLDVWNDIQKNAHIYRPRFIRLVLESTEE